MPYSDVKDLIVGTDMPLPTNPKPDQFVAAAADEIDSKIGQRYVTPVVVPDGMQYRATKLLLAKLNNFIASGRLIMAQSAGNEGQMIHAYGASLLKEACEILDRIVSGDYILQGAQTIDPADAGRSGPIISNLDAQSNVESFYNSVTTPNPFGCPDPTYIFPGGLSRPPWDFRE